jgi:restriction endonuclease S subunit
MKLKLKEIATLQTGLFAKPIPMGDVIYLQVRDFDENGELIDDLYHEMIQDNISNKHILKEGDLLFASKGNKIFSALFGYPKHSTVASTSFFVIKIKSNKILPAYLNWFINQSETINFLKQHAAGTAIASIPKSLLEEIEITIPDIFQQQKIVDLSKLAKKEHSILLKLAELKKTFIQKKITNTLK